MRSRVKTLQHQFASSNFDMNVKKICCRLKQFSIQISLATLVFNVCALIHLSFESRLSFICPTKIKTFYKPTHILHLLMRKVFYFEQIILIENGHVSQKNCVLNICTSFLNPCWTSRDLWSQSWPSRTKPNNNFKERLSILEKQREEPFLKSPWHCFLAIQFFFHLNLTIFTLGVLVMRYRVQATTLLIDSNFFFKSFWK